VTGVEEGARGSVIPQEMHLDQNYPNPFNGRTVFRFQLAAPGGRAGAGGDDDAGRVTLKIYDVLGREVGTVVDESLRSGSYEVGFDAGALSSGVCYASLQSSAGRQTMPIILVR